MREDPVTEADDLRLRWCEARLAEKSREKPTMRRDWPDATPAADEPGAWGDSVDAALAACSPGLHAEITDCEEYPCVAAIRPREDAEPERELDAVNDCLKARLGEPVWGTVGALLINAHCPDGRDEPVVMLTAMSKAGEELLGFPADDFSSIPDLYMLIGRRSESALQLWDCDSTSDGGG